MKQNIMHVMKGGLFDAVQSEQIMDQLTGGDFVPEQAASLLSLLNFRTESPQEIEGFVRSILKQAESLNLSLENAVDIVGTGGDGAGTFNISTAASLVVAATGLTVAKHGNRAVSSRSGSADVLEALGIPIQQDREALVDSLKTNNFAFLFAPVFHRAFKNLAPLRKKLEIRTALNLLGPLVNPLGVGRQVIGVYNKKFIPVIAEALKALGKKNVMVVASEDGLDEISICDVTNVSHLKDGEITSYTITPEEVGLQRAALKDIAGGSPEENAKILLDIFSGKTGAPLDVVCLNAAAGLLVAEKVKDLREGVELAKQTIISGKVLELLNNLKVGVSC